MKKFFKKYGVMTPLFVFIIVMIIGLIQHGTENLLKTTIRNIFMYLGTFQFIPSVIMHSVKRVKTAEYIGWESSGFQFTLAGYALSMAILGILCNYHEGVFWVVTTIAVTIFLWPCAAGHIIEMKKRGNFNLGNAGYILYWDIFMPLSLLILVPIHFYTQAR